MSSFYVSDLVHPLFALAIACYLLLIVWAEIRRRNPTLKKVAQTFSDEQMRSIIKGRHYRLILLGMISVVFCYTSVPALYQFLMPVRALDIPFLNFTGMAMIAVSLVWTSVMQLEFDQILFKQTDERSDVLPAVIGDYAKEIQLGYFLIMLGIALVLINAVSIALMAIACIISYNSRRVAV